MTTGSYGIQKNLGELGDHPMFGVLTDEKAQRIHEGVVEILGTVGIKVTRQEAIDMMGDNGCQVDGDIVRIPRNVLEDAIASTPKQFTMYNREGEVAMQLGSAEVYTHTGYTPLEFFDLDTGERRLYQLDDFRVVARVADALPNVDQIGQAGVVRPTDENPLEVINHLEFEAMLTNSSKPIQPLVADGPILGDCLDMAEAVAKANGNSLKEKPFIMPMLNPISPLLFHDDTVDKLMLTADRDVPVICGPMPLAGGTAPATVAGIVAQTTAESLAGMVISQLRKKGTPYVMITFAAILDMRTGNLAAGPESPLITASCLEMGHYYGVPIAGGSVFGSYRGNQNPGGMERFAGGMTRVLLRGNAGFGVGGGSSLQAVVANDEYVGLLKEMMKGVVVDDDHLGIDAIREVGPGAGTFLGSMHTYRHMKDFWQPTIMPRQRYEEWEASGKKTLDDHVEEKMWDIINTHEPKPIPDSARQTIDDIIAIARERAAISSAA